MVATTAATPSARRDARDVYRMKLALEYTANLRQHSALGPPTYPFLTARQMEPIYQDVHHQVICHLVGALGIDMLVWVSWVNPVSARHALNTESDYELLDRVHHMRTRTEEARVSRRRPGPRPPEPIYDEEVAARFRHEDGDDERVTEDEPPERGYTGVGDLRALEDNVRARTAREPGWRGLTQAQEQRRMRTEEYIRSIEDVILPEGAKTAFAPEPEPEPGKRRLRVRKP